MLRTGPGSLDPCTVIFLGSSLATTASFFLLLLRYRASIRLVPVTAFRPMLRRLLRLTVPLGFNDILRSGLSALENMLVPKGLRRSGSDGRRPSPLTAPSAAWCSP